MAASAEAVSDRLEDDPFVLISFILEHLLPAGKERERSCSRIMKEMNERDTLTLLPSLSKKKERKSNDCADMLFLCKGLQAQKSSAQSFSFLFLMKEKLSFIWALITFPPSTVPAGTQGPDGGWQVNGPMKERMTRSLSSSGRARLFKRFARPGTQDWACHRDLCCRRLSAWGALEREIAYKCAQPLRLVWARTHSISLSNRRHRSPFISFPSLACLQASLKERRGNERESPDAFLFFLFFSSIACRLL